MEEPSPAPSVRASNSSANVSIAGLTAMTLRLDDAGSVAYLNAAFAHFLDLNREEILGRPLRELRPAFPAEIFPLLAQGEPGKHQIQLARDGELTVLEITLTRQNTGLDVVLRDVSEEHRFRAYVRRYVPADLAALSSEELRTFQVPERRSMTVSFADLRGFTALSETLKPEDVRSLVNAYLEETIQAVEGNQGTVDKIVGDEVMALFGAPRFYPDHTLRAIKTACEQMERLEALRLEFERQGRKMPPCGIGLNAGEMVVGNIGSATRQNYTVMGAAVNLASRLCGIAQAGEILLNENTLHSALNQLPPGWVAKEAIEEAPRLPSLPPDGNGEGREVLPADLSGKCVRIGPSSGNPAYVFRYLYQTRVKGIEAMLPVIAVSKHRAADSAELPLRESIPASAERVFGKFRLLAWLGAGGMGEVWKARDAFGNIVAIKMLSAGEAAPEAQIARFKNEAEIMARLVHHHICRILEIGEYERTAYIAMEYIDGASLAQVLNLRPETEGARGEASTLQIALARVRLEHHSIPDSLLAEQTLILPQPQILALLQSLCAALETAHAAGVYHRDLKPGNIMIRANGEAVVTDFGLAKLVEVQRSQSLTLPGQILGTIEYMAPEQVEASSDVDERADVYGLGAILYQMLTGRKHFNATGNLLNDIVRLRNWEPVRLRRHQPRIDPDLEIITLKALQPDPAQRYRTVTALREDLLRFQKGEVIAAKPASLHEMVIKLVKRNKALTGVIVSALLILLIGGLVFTWSNYEQRLRAQLARSQAEDLVTFMVTDLRDKLEPIGRLALLGDVGRAVDKYYESLGAEGDTWEGLRNRIRALVNKGKILSAEGRSREALKSMREALVLAERVVRRAPRDPRSQHALWVALNQVADQQFFLEGTDITLATLNRALEIIQRLSAQHPEDQAYRRDLVRTLNEVARLQMVKEDLSAALTTYQSSMAIVEELVKAEPTNLKFLRDYEIGQMFLGDVLRKQSRRPEALAHFDRSIATARQILALQPHNSPAELDLSTMLLKKSSLFLDENQFAEALPLLEEVRQIRERLTRQDPQNRQWLRSASVAYEQLGMLYYQKEQPRAALPYFQQSANIADQLAKLDPANTEWQRDLSVGYQQLAHINREIGDLESSHAWYLKSFAIASTLSDKDPVNASLLQDKAIAHFDLGKILGLLKRPGEAREQLTLADQIYRRLIERDPTNEELKSERKEVEAAQKELP